MEGWVSTHRVRLAAAGLSVLVGVAVTAVVARSREPSVVIGKVDEDAPEPGPPELPVPELAPDPLLAASGRPPGPPLPFRGAVNVPGDLLFFLIIGSDARPGQDMTRSRADSIHIAATDPLSRKGTVLGLPRDAYVDVPGYGRRKINSALAIGGPELLVQTVRALTGFPVSYYAVTGFEGMVMLTDELGGLDVMVPYRMDDPRYSGARFEPGWHHMDGRQVLAFTRARHRVPGGDFGRSANQGRVIVHALEKLRAETSDEGGIRRWLEVLYRHARLDMSLGDAVQLGVLARQILPADLRNVVAPGTARTVDGQSVVELDAEAYALFRDIGADALADGKLERATPPPTPMPKPTPSPASEPTPTPAPPGPLPSPTGTPLVPVRR